MILCDESLQKFSREKLIEMYKGMFRIRCFEDKVYYLFLQGFLSGTIHQCQGQEAAEVGVCSALRRDDFIAPNHRSHGHTLAKGISVDSVMAELYSKRTGCCHGKGGSMHLADASSGILPATGVIGESIVLATGVGLAFKMQKTNRVAVAFFGDGASNIGSFHEGINMGAIWKLPVLYICENNQYAASTPVKTMVPVENISDRAVAYNIPGIKVDGMDVIAVYKVVEEAVERARSGQGPTLIECKTYRYVGHSRVDSAKYRSREELEIWRAKDAILGYKKQLIENKVVTQKEIDEINKEISAEIDQSAIRAEKSPDPNLLEALNDVYA